MKQHKFKQHVLGILKGDKIPGVWLFTDTETKVKITDDVPSHHFHLGWIFLCTPGWEKEGGPHEDYYFDGEISYLQYIERSALKYVNLVVCGHNVFFDLQAAGFFIHFKEWGWELDYLYDKGLIFILKVTKGGNSITILSSTNWFDCSLKELGKMIDLPKQEVNFDNVSKADLRNYCYRDTEIVMTAMRYYLKFIRENDLGRFALTKSSQALVGYRKHFMNKKIFIHSEDKVHELERKAYMGGRTEAFRIGDVKGKPFVTLDVNGMYPFVMQKYRYPSKLAGYLEDEPREKYEELLGSWLMIAEVELDTLEPVFAVKHKGKTVFPTGSFTAFLCTEALKYALSHGYIKRFIRAAVYNGEDLFSDYVKYFADLRQQYLGEDNKAMERLCKYMHNTLYGKFGEREIVTVIEPGDKGHDYYRDEIIDGVNGGVWIETYLLNRTIIQHYEGESPHSSAAVAAHITENARMTLWEIIRTTGRDKVLYCDTDSVIISKKAVRDVIWPIHNNELGALKVQSDYTTLHIDGAKSYRTDSERHIKGIPAGAKEVSPGVFEYMHFKRMCMCLREGHCTGVPVEMLTRRLVSKYDKGVVTSSGKVEPLLFPLSE